jgi:hypothetical protein
MIIYFAKSKRAACGNCGKPTLSVVGTSKDRITHQACPDCRLIVGSHLTAKPVADLKLEQVVDENPRPKDPNDDAAWERYYDNGGK